MNWLPIGGLILAVVGVGLTALSWLRPRRINPRLAWTWISSTSLVDEAAATVPSLRVLFREREVDRMTMWTGKMWNTGPGAVRGDDLRNLGLKFGDAEIFGAWLSGVTSTENVLRAVSDADSRRVSLEFDFLNAGDGGDFVVLHSGPSTLHPSLEGAVVGARIEYVTAVSGEEDPTRMRPSFILLFYIIATMSMMGSVVGLFKSDAAFNDPVVRSAIGNAITSEYMVTFVLGGAALWAVYAWIIFSIRVQREGEPPANTLIRLDSAGGVQTRRAGGGP